MSLPAPLSAPDTRALAPAAGPRHTGAVTLASALLAALLPSAASAACSGAAVTAATTVCQTAQSGGQPMTTCHQQLNQLWTECQQENRQAGQPFPPYGADDPSYMVYATRNVFGLPTWPELRADMQGEARDANHWSEARRAAEYQHWQHNRDTFRGSGTGGAALPDGTQEYDGAEPPANTTPPPPRFVPPREQPTTAPPPPPMIPRGQQRGDDGGGQRLVVTPNGTPPMDRGDVTRVRLADQAIQQNPRDSGAMALRARGRMLMGDRDGAFDDARRTLELDPKNQDARRILGGSDAIGGSAGRIGRMKVGLEASPEDAGGLGGGAGREERGGGRMNAAEFAAPDSLKTAPQDARGAQLRELWNGAQRYANMGDWGNALREASRLVSLNPDDPESWILRSKISSKMGNWEAAEADARKALELRPDDPAALLILGRALVQQGKVVDGLAVIERALALQPRNALAHYYRGEALEKLGRKGEAIDEYNLALQLDPGLGPLVEEALARLNPNMAVPQGGRGAPAAPAKRWLRLGVALVGSLFLLKGLHFLVGGRLRTSFTAKPATTTRPPLREEDQQASVLGRDPIAGDVLGGNFKVERELARGGMGVVYLATDIVLRRLVAIKRLHWEHMRTEETRRKFLQEAQLAARLKHPNLAQIHSVFGERELYLVFELVEGQTLDALLAAKGRLGLTEVRAIVGQVCRALEHAHGHRVIHRDLKPANIMLSRDGSCKVMDFGIAHEARTASNATQTQAWGTPPYMAPEQEEGYVSPASDLYALAVVAYELLAGRRPFDGPSQHAAKRTAAFKRIGGQDGLPAELDRFFERALHPEAALRYTTAADFRAAFEELAGTPVAR
jgi:tetratricopeptide (TPR) repeat protein/predicted Ser/Thr protein kinase